MSGQGHRLLRSGGFLPTQAPSARTCRGSRADPSQPIGSIIPRVSRPKTARYYTAGKRPFKLETPVIRGCPRVMTTQALGSHLRGAVARSGRVCCSGRTRDGQTDCVKGLCQSTVLIRGCASFVSVPQQKRPKTNQLEFAKMPDFYGWDVKL